MDEVRLRVMTMGLLVLALMTTWVYASQAVARSPEAVASARSYTIRTSDGAVTRIGAFRPRRDPTISGAERVFGTASSKELTKYGGCRVEWRRLRLRILFYNFGGHGPGETTCTPSVGRSQSFSVRGTRFRTWRGLRVRHRSDTILDRHPNAEFRRRTWWLKTAVSPFGDQSEYPVVNAIVSRGRVRSIAGWIGAAGE